MPNNDKRKQLTKFDITIFYKPKKQTVDHNISDTSTQSNIQLNNKT